MTGESRQYCIDWMALTDELKARRDTQDAGTKDLLIYQRSFASQNGSCHDYDKQYLTFPYDIDVDSRVYCRFGPSHVASFPFVNISDREPCCQTSVSTTKHRILINSTIAVQNDSYIETLIQTTSLSSLYRPVCCIATIGVIYLS